MQPHPWGSPGANMVTVILSCEGHASNQFLLGFPCWVWIWLPSSPCTQRLLSIAVSCEMPAGVHSSSGCFSARSMVIPNMRDCCLPQCKQTAGVSPCLGTWEQLCTGLSCAGKGTVGMVQPPGTCFGSSLWCCKVLPLCAGLRWVPSLCAGGNIIYFFNFFSCRLLSVLFSKKQTSPTATTIRW